MRNQSSIPAIQPRSPTRNATIATICATNRMRCRGQRDITARNRKCFRKAREEESRQRSIGVLSRVTEAVDVVERQTLEVHARIGGGAYEVETWWCGICRDANVDCNGRCVVSEELRCECSSAVVEVSAKWKVSGAEIGVVYGMQGSFTTIGRAWWTMKWIP